MAKGPQGTPTGSMDYSPGRKAKDAAKRRGQDKRWAAKAGPVTVRKIGDPEPARRQEAVEVFYEPAPSRRRRPTGKTTTNSPPVKTPAPVDENGVRRRLGPNAQYRATLGLGPDDPLPRAGGTGQRT